MNTANHTSYWKTTMNRSLLAVSMLGAFAGVASAQSNVQIYGVVDVGISRTDTNRTEPDWGVTSGQQNGSRIGFRGTEDLGSGLSAIFTLESGFNVDTGSQGQGGRLFGRQAFVGLSSKRYGTVTLGRQHTLNHNAINIFDPFATNLAGNSENAIPGAGALGLPGLPYFIAGSVLPLAASPTGSALPVGVSPVDNRVDNSIVYQTNSYSGFSGALQYSFGEQSSAFANGRQIAASGTYSNGPIAAVATYHTARANAGGIDQNSYLIGGSYNFGIAKVHAGFQNNEIEADVTTFKSRTYLLGTTVPVGAGNFMASWIRADIKSFDAKSDQVAIGYTYPLSNRTSLYTSAAWQRSDGVGAGDVKANILNAGIRHVF